MSFYIFLWISLVNILCDFHVSCCDEACTDKPVFTPPRLVVKHGDSTSSTCVVCRSGCEDSVFGLENSVGKREINGTRILWTVERLTEWRTSPMCYYNTENGDQCCSTLSVIVYKPPDRVSISFDNLTEPMREDQQYTLQCEVSNVAPVENLAVTFYRGLTPLVPTQYKQNSEKEPVTEIYSHRVTARKEDDGAHYWCEAKLELGPEGPDPTPVVKSQHINTTVYYKPQLMVSQNQISITEGDRLSLNCSAVGNPSPSYTWTVPMKSAPPPNSSILTIESVALEDSGEYRCSATNVMGSLSVSFNVEVQANYMPYFLAAAVICFVVIVIVVALVYIHYYKENRMGEYNLKDVFRRHKQHQLVPSV